MSFENPSTFKTLDQQREEIDASFSESVADLKETGASITESVSALEGVELDHEQKEQVIKMLEDLKQIERRLKMIR